MVYIATRWSSALRASTRSYLNGTLSGAFFYSRPTCPIRHAIDKIPASLEVAGTLHHLHRLADRVQSKRLRVQLTKWDRL